jgi:hypothetical protein
LGAVTTGVKTGNDGAHAGTGNGVNGNAMLLQNLEDSDVGEAHGASAAENDRNLQPSVINALPAGVPILSPQESNTKTHDQERFPSHD